jgi:hemerythrin-like metal-binding protein
MDDQHGVLMDAMNELRLGLVRGCGRERVSELLDELIEFSRMHFSSEEQLMERSGFPGLGQHAAEHQSMLTQMLEVARRIQRGERIQLRPLLCRLREGFHEHIESQDQQYGPWLNERDIL